MISGGDTIQSRTVTQHSMHPTHGRPSRSLPTSPAILASCGGWRQEEVQQSQLLLGHSCGRKVIWRKYVK